MLELHHRSQHLVQQVVVGKACFKLPDLLQADGRQVSTSATSLLRLCVYVIHTLRRHCAAGSWPDS